MTDHIELNATGLVLQAPQTVAGYLRHAITSIDGELGDGYAARNPSLIGAFIIAAASDFNACCLAQQLRAGLDEVVAALDNCVSDGLADITDAIKTHDR